MPDQRPDTTLGLGSGTGVDSDIAFDQRTLPFQTFRPPVDPDELGDLPGLAAHESRHGKKDIPFEDIRPATDAERGSVALVSTLSDHKVTQL